MVKLQASVTGMNLCKDACDALTSPNKSYSLGLVVARAGLDDISIELYDLEMSYAEPEKKSAIDLPLDQIEEF